MSDLNRATILGRLGADPESRSVGETSVTSLSVATSEKWKDKNSGQMQERTEWHRVELWGRVGEVAAQYLRKGSQVYLEGRIRTDKYQDKETGQDRYSTKIIGDRMQLIGGKGEGQASPAADPAPAGGGFDDDIPFAAVPWGAAS